MVHQKNLGKVPHQYPYQLRTKKEIIRMTTSQSYYIYIVHASWQHHHLFGHYPFPTMWSQFSLRLFSIQILLVGSLSPSPHFAFRIFFLQPHIFSALFFFSFFLVISYLLLAHTSHSRFPDQKVGHWSFISEEFEMKALVGDLLGPRPFDCSNLRNSMKIWMLIFGTLVVMGLLF